MLARQGITSLPTLPRIYLGEYLTPANQRKYIVF